MARAGKMIEHYKKLRIALLDLIEQIRDELPEEDVKEALDFVEHNEFGVSFELICAQLFEYDIKVSADIYRKIEEIGRSMTFDDSVWQMLKN